MRKQCLMFMLLLAASERAEKNPLKIKFRKDIVESYKPIVWAEPRPISMLQNVSHCRITTYFYLTKVMTAKLTNCELSFLTEKRRNIALSRRRNLAMKVINPAKRNFVPAGQKFKFRRNRISFQHEIS